MSLPIRPSDSVYAVPPGIVQVHAVAPVVDTSAYAANDLIGAPVLLDGVAPLTEGVGSIISVVITDADQQDAPLSLVFFKSAPTTGPDFTDNVELDVARDDLLKEMVGVIPVVALDYVDFKNNSVATLPAVGLGFSVGKEGKLWLVVMSEGSPTYTNSDALGFFISTVEE